MFERFRVERRFAQSSLCVELERLNVALFPLFIVAKMLLIELHFDMTHFPSPTLSQPIPNSIRTLNPPQPWARFPYHGSPGTHSPNRSRPSKLLSHILMLIRIIPSPNNIRLTRPLGPRHQPTAPLRKHWAELDPSLDLILFGPKQ